MKTKTKIATSLTACVLSGAMLFTIASVTPNTHELVTASTRTVGIAKNNVDAQSVLSEFDNAKLTKSGMTTYFEGYQALDASSLSKVDYISEKQLDEFDSCVVKYNVSFDSETNIVTIAASTNLPDGSYDIDEISGVAFINENGEVDAVMDVDGESILLSEMREAGLIENCGWLSRLIKGAMATVVAVVGGIGTAVIAVAVNHIVEESAALVNKKKNEKLPNPTNYINEQGLFKDWGYGLTNLAKGGCGIIAIFNAMIKLNKKPNLAEIIYEFDSKSGNLFWGAGGADVTHIQKYFNDRDIPNSFYDEWVDMKVQLKNMTKNQIAICSYWCSRLPLKGHYVAIERTYNTIGIEVFRVYNDGGFVYHDYENLDSVYLNKLLLNGDFINGYIIGEVDEQTDDN